MVNETTAAFAEETPAAVPARAAAHTASCVWTERDVVVSLRVCFFMGELGVVRRYVRCRKGFRKTSADRQSFSGKSQVC
jgi:hypothetical protein